MAGPGVVIIGAGMTGLIAARELRAHGIESIVLDKSRAAGGRMSSRTIGEARFDQGAQHFGLRDPAFRQAASEWLAAGIVREWYHAEEPNPDGTDNIRHVGWGGMRTIPEHLALDLDLRLGNAVTELVRTPGGVAAQADGNPLATRAAAILTMPVPQTLRLLDASGLTVPAEIRTPLENVNYHACLAAMARLDGPAGLPAGHATPSGGQIAWIGDNQHKGVSEVPAVTIHSTPAFAADHLEEDPETWVPALCAAAAPILGSQILTATGHRWRYAEPQHTLDTGAASFTPGFPLVLSGEVFAGARIEGAFQSGRVAAATMISLL